MGELQPGSRFAGFQIESVLGAGGMGVVYRATQLALERTVALKLITPDFAADEDFRERFKRESRLAASIDHPNVVTVYEAGEDAGQLYIAMRYVEGTDLHALIAAEGALEPARATHLLSQVAGALDAAHAHGLVHRDVKPANVLIAVGDHAYLTDFGLTKRTASVGPTKTGQWVGSADYVAPEQIQGEPVDARADVYALGCVLYHMLTGKPPFTRDSEVAKIWAHVNDPPPSLPESSTGPPPALDGVIRRAMAKAPGDRYPSAGDLGRAASAGLEGRATSEPERSIAAGAAA
ncbi:MAG: serine/threonine protein kinase, partial [Actinomycetota bacterium]|nr:serine/threonine protein kinase [Actinomycetota bacterium]